MFVAHQGGTKRHRTTVVIQSSSSTKLGRRTELARFKRELRKLAKKYRGTVKEPRRRAARKRRRT